MDIQFIKICAILCGILLIIALCIIYYRRRRAYRSIGKNSPNPYFPQRYPPIKYSYSPDFYYADV